MPQPRTAAKPAAGDRARARRAAAPRNPRPVTPAEADQWRQGLTAGGAATAITGVASATAATVPPALVAAIAAKGAAKLTAAQVKAAITLLLSALARFHRSRLPEIERLSGEVFVTVYPDASSAEMQALRRMEREYHREFVRKQSARVEAGMRKALAAGDGKQNAVAARRDAVEQMLRNERRWAAAHEEAVAARAAGWSDAVQAAAASGGNVVWKLGQRKNHTADCVAMHGRILPLAALVQERFIPPVHFLCGCRVRTVAEALDEGVIRETTKPLTMAAAVRVIRAAKALEHG